MSAFMARIQRHHGRRMPRRSDRTRGTARVADRHLVLLDAALQRHGRRSSSDCSTSACTPFHGQRLITLYFAQRLSQRNSARVARSLNPLAGWSTRIFGGLGLPRVTATFKGAGCTLPQQGRVRNDRSRQYLPASAAVRRRIAHRLPVEQLRTITLEAGLVPMRDEALG